MDTEKNTESVKNQLLNAMEEWLQSDYRSLQGLADLAGVSRYVVHRFYKRKTPDITTDNASALAKAMGKELVLK